MQELSRKCGMCGKVINASSTGQLEYNFDQHVQKHKRAAKMVAKA